MVEVNTQRTDQADVSVERKLSCRPRRSPIIWIACLAVAIGACDSGQDVRVANPCTHALRVTIYSSRERANADVAKLRSSDLDIVPPKNSLTFSMIGRVDSDGPPLGVVVEQQSGTKSVFAVPLQEDGVTLMLPEAACR